MAHIQALTLAVLQNQSYVVAEIVTVVKDLLCLQYEKLEK